MFESLLNSSLALYMAPMAAAMGAFLGVWGLLKGLTRKKSMLETDDEWRDPPPLMYKLFKPAVRFFAPEIAKFLSEKTTKKLSQKLSAAGMSYAILPEELVTLRFVCMLVGIILSVSFQRAHIDDGSEMLALLMMVPIVAFFYPDLWLTDQITRRRKSVTKEFPFLLDLLVLSMRAGLNYSGALAQAIGAMPPGAVRDEFSKLLREIRAGKSRRDALLDLGDRMSIESINNFVAAINQAEETGGEIVDVLMAQAQQRRAERFNSAEEMANKAPVRMLLPMMAFLFPIIFMLMGFIIVVKLGEIGYLPQGMMDLLR